MRSGRPKELCRTVVSEFTGWVAIAVGVGMLLAAPNTIPAEPADDPPPTNCIALVTPSVEGMPGNVGDTANAVRELMASYLRGPSRKVVVLEAKLPSLAAEEAKQKGCQPLLISSVHRKSRGGHGFMKALSQAAGAASWNLPYGSSPASNVARAGTAAGLQTVASIAQATKAKDEISFKYQLQSADGQVQFGPRTDRRTANTDGEDLLTPVVAHAAEAIVAQNAAMQAAPAGSVRESGVADDPSTRAVQFLDHLKTCTPYTFKYPHPLVPSFTGQNIIQGKKGDKCQVTYLMPNNLKMECEHSPATIRRMTSEAAYKKARSDEFGFSFFSGTEDPASRECHLFQAGKVLSLGGQ